MFRRHCRFCHSAFLRLLLHGLCILLGLIALCLVFSFLASHLGMVVGVSVLIGLIVIIQWLICTM